MSSGAKKSYPKKLYYKIHEVAQIIGVEDYVLRYWETRFPMLKPEKQRGDQRRYRQKDIELLLKIQQLVHIESYSINDAVEILKSKDKRRKASPPSKPMKGNSKKPISVVSQNGASQNGSSHPNNVNQGNPRMQQELFDESEYEEKNKSPEEKAKDEKHSDSLRDELLALREELEAMREEIK